MSENVNNVEQKNEKRGIFAEAKAFWSDVGAAMKKRKMGKVLVGTAIGVVVTTGVAVGTVVVTKKLRGKNDEEPNYIPEDAKDVTPTEETTQI